jgi:hypothetical protein
MKIQLLLGLLAIGLANSCLLTMNAEPLDAALQTKVDAQIKVVQGWASDPVIVAAVKAQNAALAPEYAAMTQDTWKDLGKLDPLVRALDKSAAGSFLKGKKSDLIIRAFVSDAEGRKVAFTTKTLSWSHKGDPKHEVPMTGKTWEGSVEQDKASGFQQIQISVPVLDQDKPIGSLVIGLSVSNL